MNLSSSSPSTWSHTTAPTSSTCLILTPLFAADLIDLVLVKENDDMYLSALKRRYLLSKDYRGLIDKRDRSRWER